MAEESQSEQSKTSLSSHPETPPSEDWFLQVLVSMANEIGLITPITLQMNGFLVSGLTVSGWFYFEQLASEFATRFETPQDRDGFKDLLLSYSEDHKRADNKKTVLEPAYIHLKEARFFHNSGNPMPGNQPVLWRGRISEVSGFFLEQMLPSDESAV